MRGKLGLFFGLITGAILGFLFAPKPGSKLRAEISKERASGGTGLDALKGTVKEIGSEMTGKIKKSKYVQKAASLKKKIEDSLE